MSIFENFSRASKIKNPACWEKSQTLIVENLIDFLQSKSYGFLGFRQGENSTFYKTANLRRIGYALRNFAEITNFIIEKYFNRRKI